MRFRMFLTKEEMRSQGYAMPGTFAKTIISIFYAIVAAAFSCVWMFTVFIGEWSFTIILLIIALLFLCLTVFKRAYNKNSYIDIFNNYLSYRSWPKKEVQMQAAKMKSIGIILYTGAVSGSLAASNGKYGIIIQSEYKTFVEMPFTRTAWSLLLQIAPPNCQIDISQWIDNESILEGH